MTRASEFFAWFARSAPRIEAAYRAGELSALADEVSARVDRVERGLGWEIGPSQRRGHALYFAFSAGLDGQRLDCARRLVADAPSVPGWELLPALPAKRWSRRVAIFRLPDGPCRVDFDRWSFSARSTRHGCVVRFVQTGLEVEEPARERLGWDLLEFELGQELTIDAVSDVVVVDRLRDGRPIDELRDAVRELAREDPD